MDSEKHKAWMTLFRQASKGLAEHTVETARILVNHDGAELAMLGTTVSAATLIDGQGGLAINLASLAFNDTVVTIVLGAAVNMLSEALDRSPEEIVEKLFDVAFKENHGCQECGGAIMHHMMKEE